MGKNSVAVPDKLKPFDKEDDDLVHVVIETPKGSRNKFKYDPDLGCYTLSSVLPEGMVFPFDFGFVPSTKADDGDPVDVLLLMDSPVFSGCVVKSRLVGVIEAEQTEDGETSRNDRLIAVAAASRKHGDVKKLSDLDDQVVAEIEHFFENYNREEGKKFKVLSMRGPTSARKTIKQSLK